MVGIYGWLCGCNVYAGINFLQVPTTLLALKCLLGENRWIILVFGKNLVGAFRKAKLCSRHGASTHFEWLRLDGWLRQKLSKLPVSLEVMIYSRNLSRELRHTKGSDDCVAVKPAMSKRWKWFWSGAYAELRYTLTHVRSRSWAAMNWTQSCCCTKKELHSQPSLSYDLGWCSIECRDQTYMLCLKNLVNDLSIDFPACDIANTMPGDKKELVMPLSL